MDLETYHRESSIERNKNTHLEISKQPPKMNDISSQTRKYNLRTKSSSMNRTIAMNKSITNKQNQSLANVSPNNGTLSSSTRTNNLLSIPKSRPAPLSKYRRKTANLRERCRMQEINHAFKRLQSVVPDIFSISDSDKSSDQKNNNHNTEQTHQSMANKLTKINTLKLAVNYISALTQILNQTSALADENHSIELNNRLKHSDEDKWTTSMMTNKTQLSPMVMNASTSSTSNQNNSACHPLEHEACCPLLTNHNGPMLSFAHSHNHNNSPCYNHDGNHKNTTAPILNLDDVDLFDDLDSLLFQDYRP